MTLTPQDLEQLKTVLATKEDIQTVKHELGKNIQAAKTELTKDIQVVKSELTNDIQTVKAELTKDIQTVKAELTTKIDTQTAELKTFAKEQTEELARIIAITIANPMQQRFDQLDKLLLVQKEVDSLKFDVLQIKQALHLSS